MDDHKVLSNRHHTLAFTLYSLPLRTEHTTYANESTTEAYHKKTAHSAKRILLYDCCTDIYWRTCCISVCSFLFKRF